MPESSPPRPFEALGRAVALRRTQLGFKRRDLADRAALSYPYISEIENGFKQPSGTALTRIAEALDFDPSELLALSETLEQEGSHRNESHTSEGSFRDSLYHLGLSTGDVPDRTTQHSVATEAVVGDNSEVAQLVRAEIRRELDSWAAYRLPELIRQELRRVAPKLLSEPDE